jgi:hypothetical protein
MMDWNRSHDARRQDLKKAQQEAKQIEGSQKKPPTAWLYIPFDDYTDDQQDWAQSIQDEQTRNPRYKYNFETIFHEKNKEVLSRVQPGDRVYVLAHGNKDGTFISPVQEVDEQTEGYPLTPDQLAKQMVESGLNPSDVKLKLGICYSGGITNPENPQEAELTQTFARTFAEKLGNRLLARGRDLPESVDGYVGKYLSQAGPEAKDVEQTHEEIAPRHNSAGIPKDLLNLIEEDTNKTMQFFASLEGGDNEDVDLSYQVQDKLWDGAAQKRLKDRQDLRARDNRVRYLVTRSQKDSNMVDVSVDQTDLERAQKERKKAPPSFDR